MLDARLKPGVSRAEALAVVNVARRRRALALTLREEDTMTAGRPRIHKAFFRMIPLAFTVALPVCSQKAPAHPAVPTFSHRSDVSEWNRPRRDESRSNDALRHE